MRAGVHVLSQKRFAGVGGDAFAGGGKKTFLTRAFSYAVHNRGDGGVGPHPSLLFTPWLRRQVPPPPIIRKRSNDDHNAPADAEMPP
jgi:hypothetical protein